MFWYRCSKRCKRAIECNNFDSLWCDFCLSWCNIECRNRETRILWWYWFKYRCKSEYRLWCCKENRRNVRNKRTNVCWFFFDFTDRFWCESSKIQTFDRFSSMMFANMLVKFVIEFEILFAKFAFSNVHDFLNRWFFHRFWCALMCLNREMQISRWNRSRRHFRWEYLISWCCRRNRRNVRNKRTSVCWFLDDFVCRFTCRDSKNRVSNRFSSMMLTYMLVKFVIEIETLFATFANSSANDLLNREFLHQFWCKLECTQLKTESSWRIKLQRCFCIWCQISWCCENEWFVQKKRTNVNWFVFELACRFDCIDAFQDFMFTDVLEKLFIEIKILFALFAFCLNVCDFLNRWVFHRFRYSYENI